MAIQEKANAERLNRTDVGRALKVLRQGKDMLQKEAAVRCGITQSIWSKMERGEIAMTLERLQDAADALGVTVQEVLIEAGVLELEGDLEPPASRTEQP